MFRISRNVWVKCNAKNIYIALQGQHAENLNILILHRLEHKMKLYEAE